MRLLKLKMQAFGPYISLQELDFAKELSLSSFLLIHGATGAGKTTIMDAICFALYGTASGEGRKGEMLRSDAAAPNLETFVEFYFAIGNKKFRIWRRPSYRRDNFKTKIEQKAELWRVDDLGIETLIASKYGEVTEYIEALIGFAVTQFRQVVLLPQGEFRRFLVANSQERGKIIERLFRTERYQQIEYILKEKANELEKNTRELRQQIQNIYEQEKITSLSELVELESGISKEINLSNIKIKELNNKRNRAIEALAIGRENYQKFIILEQAHISLEEHLAKKEQVDDYRVKLLLADKALPLLIHQKYLLEAEAELNKVINDIETYEQDYNNAIQQHNMAKENLLTIDGITEQRKVITQNILDLKKYHEICRSYIETIKMYDIAKDKIKQAENTKLKLQQEETTLSIMISDIIEKNNKLNNFVATKDNLEARQLSIMQQINLINDYKTQNTEFHEATINLEKAQQDMNFIKNEREEASKQLDRLQIIFESHSAARLATHLESGQPCPVCGATTHPNLAVYKGIIPSELELKEIKNKVNILTENYENQQSIYNNKKNYLVEIETKLLSIKQQIGEVNDLQGMLSDLQEVYQSIIQKLEEVSRAEQEEKNNKAEQLKLENILSNLRENLIIANEIYDKEKKIFENAERVKISNELILPEKYRDLDFVTRELQQNMNKERELDKKTFDYTEQERLSSERVKEINTILVATRKRVEDKNNQVERLKNEFTKRLMEANFNSEEEYQAATTGSWGNKDFCNDVRNRIKIFEDITRDKENSLKEAKNSIIGIEKPDINELEKVQKATDYDWQKEIEKQTDLKARYKQINDTIDNLKKLNETENSLTERYKAIGRMADVATAESPYTIHFQTYIQRAILSDVIEAANNRITVMSRGRYRLCHGRMRDARSWQGLEIEVYDEYTGKQRQSETLSGGEAFLTSLSLALGLSDVVQMYAGGIKLDTIFIDEGFGTLDSETLDIAIATLINLQRESNRLVGIISHVEELKTRIHNQIEVIKTNNGSKVKFLVT